MGKNIQDYVGYSAYSPRELSGRPGQWKLNDGATTRDLDPSDELVIRAWIPHPERSAEADAPVRAVLPVARELRALSLYVSSQVDSRVAGAGLLRCRADRFGDRGHPHCRPAPAATR